MTNIERYGVQQESPGATRLDIMEEEIRLLGYTTLDAGFTVEELDRYSDLFDQTADKYAAQALNQGYDIQKINEGDTIRVLPAHEKAFWDIVFNASLHSLLERLLGNYYILNQVNGLINRRNSSAYHQSKYHRDLPYQHFTSSRPLAINALFAIDDFTLENGATRVVPASQHREAFPPAALVKTNEKQIEVPRGTFIVLDCMLYHAGSTNRSTRDRRAINHVFTIPMMRQQFHLPSILGDNTDFSDNQKRLLGFGLEEFQSVETWFQSRGKAAT
ncbi:phytanoyl-CoA dioxygenase family protein [Roseobacter sp. S98]|uniref:phytanoyl-CoA dioxygenase family protein n=1 Tax=Roseobacter algicola (ex Choi et al. 2025) (nom. illeg.) TaxID=3092138 RepID=UPI003F515E7E